MANTNDTTTCARTNEKNTNPLIEPLSLMPSMSSEYLLKPESSWGDLLRDSSLLLSSGIEVLKALADDVDTEFAYGSVYLMEAAQTTLREGYDLALKADPIGGDPDDFESGMDLVVEFIKTGRTEQAIHMAECIKRNVVQSIGYRAKSNQPTISEHFGDNTGDLSDQAAKALLKRFSASTPCSSELLNNYFLGLIDKLTKGYTDDVKELLEAFLGKLHIKGE